MPTHYKGTAAEVDALNAYITLMRAAESVTARLAPILSQADLSLSQFGIMEALYHLGPMNQTELGRKILKSSGNITMVVDNLEKRGLVKRCREESDRRVVTVSLTETGQHYIADFFPRHVAQIVAEMGVLTSEEQQQLRTLCRKLGRRSS